MAFRWRADDVPTLNACLGFQGIRTSIAKKPCIFVIFQGEGPDPPPPLDPRMHVHVVGAIMNISMAW